MCLMWVSVKHGCVPSVWVCLVSVCALRWFLPNATLVCLVVVLVVVGALLSCHMRGVGAPQVPSGDGHEVWYTLSRK